MDCEINLKSIALGVVETRRVIARDSLWLGSRAGALIRKEQFHMVVETEAGEAIKVAAKSDADHVGCDLIDLRHLELAAARFMTNPARRACRVIQLLRSDGGVF